MSIMRLNHAPARYDKPIASAHAKPYPRFAPPSASDGRQRALRPDSLQTTKQPQSPQLLPRLEQAKALRQSSEIVASKLADCLPGHWLLAESQTPWLSSGSQSLFWATWGHWPEYWPKVTVQPLHRYLHFSQQEHSWTATLSSYLQIVASERPHLYPLDEVLLCQIELPMVGPSKQHFRWQPLSCQLYPIPAGAWSHLTPNPLAVQHGLTEQQPRQSAQMPSSAWHIHCSWQCPDKTIISQIPMACSSKALLLGWDKLYGNLQTKVPKLPKHWSSLVRSHIVYIDEQILLMQLYGQYWQLYHRQEPPSAI